MRAESWHTNIISIIFQWFRLIFAGVGVQAYMSPPFVIVSLPSMLQRVNCVNGLTSYDGRDDEQVIRINYK
jgi:hypothetical protein